MHQTSNALPTKSGAFDSISSTHLLVNLAGLGAGVRAAEVALAFTVLMPPAPNSSQRLHLVRHLHVILAATRVAIFQLPNKPVNITRKDGLDRICRPSTRLVKRRVTEN